MKLSGEVGVIRVGRLRVDLVVMLGSISYPPFLQSLFPPKTCTGKTPSHRVRRPITELNPFSPGSLPNWHPPHIRYSTSVFGSAAPAMEGKEKIGLYERETAQLIWSLLHFSFLKPIFLR